MLYMQQCKEILEIPNPRKGYRLILCGGKTSERGNRKRGKMCKEKEEKGRIRAKCVQSKYGWKRKIHFWRGRGEEGR
jgi:hypothetical protein